MWDTPGYRPLKRKNKPILRYKYLPLSSLYLEYLNTHPDQFTMQKTKRLLITIDFLTSDMSISKLSRQWSITPEAMRQKLLGSFRALDRFIQDLIESNKLPIKIPFNFIAHSKAAHTIQEIGRLTNATT